jgi:hypothetical protein
VSGGAARQGGTDKRYFMPSPQKGDPNLQCYRWNSRTDVLILCFRVVPRTDYRLLR